MDELIDAVNAAFVETGRGIEPWPDPYPDRSPPDEAYSRVTDPPKWRIVGARADAWLAALVGLGLADVEREASVRWVDPPGTTISRTDRVVPRASGALPLILARSRIESVDDAGVTLGAGDPAVTVEWIPDCGCDACDSGSQDALDELDEYLVSVVSGAFRRLTRRNRTITVIADGRKAASGRFRRGEIDAIAARPKRWHETSGTPWLDCD